MRWTRALFLIVAICWAELSCTVAIAEEFPPHLIPETGYFNDPRFDDEYYSLLRRHFAGRTHQWAQVVVLPSNDREEVVSIEGPDVASAQLIHSKAKESIWLAYAKVTNANSVARDGQRSVRALRTMVDKLTIPVERRVASMNRALQARLVRAWIAFLRTTHYGPFFDHDDDGTTYHFTAFVLHYGVIAGQTSSPSSKSLPGTFVGIGRLLAEYADATEATRPGLQGQIEAALRQAEQRLGL